MTPYCKHCNRIKPISDDERFVKYMRILVTRAGPVYSQIGFINSLVKFKTDALEIVSNDLDYVWNGDEALSGLDAAAPRGSAWG